MQPAGQLPPRLKLRLWKLNDALPLAALHVAMQAPTDGVIVPNVQPIAQLGVR